jgi:predicted dithiol-disulfide oxidoreductase (DUF899 family)
MSQSEIEKTEQEITQLVIKLEKMRKDNPRQEVKDYRFKTLAGESSLSEFFGNKSQLFVIHNMGQACRYCTLWADGINTFLPHLENEFAVLLVSKDSPEEQRRMAGSRAWRFIMASHSGGEYIKEQSVCGESSNMPGIVLYEKEGSKIFKKNWSAFGPRDLFCSLWHFISLAGRNEENWTPQFSYWKRPQKMEDGGQNLN